MITSTMSQLRDPFILLENGVYYAYGTGYRCYKNTSGRLDGVWTEIKDFYVVPNSARDQFWAPEVHRYNGAYYMFASYRNDLTSHRGTAIFRSDSPEGPFVEITSGHATPAHWDAIDGTFYVDGEGQPWMVFVHEWTSLPDHVGWFAAAKLSSDLTHFVSEPIELFRADAPAWTDRNVTDGCFMYTTADGQLLMLWSNFEADGYAVGISRSVSGRIDGDWTHDPVPLYKKGTLGNPYDGGHGMLFKDADGQMYLSIHSPNTPVGDRKEVPIFLPTAERDGTLCLV